MEPPDLSDILASQITKLKRRRSWADQAAPSSPRYRHPGHHIFGYELEGTYKLKLDQGAETILTKGQTFHEAPGQLHAVSANPSLTEPAKVLAFIVAESGKPITVPEKQ